MNYDKIYLQIIEKAFSEGRIKSEKFYYEKHHIIPKCLGGEDEKDNLVFLTPKEHYICHKLLCEMFSEEPKLIYAFWMMCSANAIKNEANYKVPARVYERSRIEMFKLRKEDLKHFYETEKGRKHREFQSKNAHFGGRNLGGEIHPRYGSKFKIVTNEINTKHIGINDKIPTGWKLGVAGHNFMFCKKIIMFDTSLNTLKVFKSIKLAAKYINLAEPTAISKVLFGKHSHCYGYLFRYFSSDLFKTLIKRKLNNDTINHSIRNNGRGRFSIKLDYTENL